MLSVMNVFYTYAAMDFFYYQTNYVIFKYVILFFKKIEFETY